MDTEDYLIHELAEKVGISVRTIRYYISEGLLPAPDIKGRYATFTEEYRLRLELILKLKDAFLPLKEIRDRIVGLDPNQVKQLLDELESPGYRPGAYPPSPEPNAQAIKESPLNSALDYLASINQEQGTVKAAPWRDQLNLPPTLAIKPQRQAPGEVETWQRIILAPGLELHVRPSEEPYYRERIRQIVEFVKIQFS